MKKGTERVPEENYRLRNEDAFEGTTKDSFDRETSGSDKSKKHLESTHPDHKHKDGVFREASQTLYARNGDKKVSLADFTIKKVIGRGSFGKVFLVEKKNTKEVFAMKSLRKDVILDYDQVESTKLEKEILL